MLCKSQRHSSAMNGASFELSSRQSVTLYRGLLAFSVFSPLLPGISFFRGHVNSYSHTLLLNLTADLAVSCRSKAHIFNCLLNICIWISHCHHHMTHKIQMLSSPHNLISWSALSAVNVMMLLLYHYDMSSSTFFFIL